MILSRTKLVSTNEPFPALFVLFSSFQHLTVHYCSLLKIVDCWIRTWVLWHWKLLLCQLCNNDIIFLNFWNEFYLSFRDVRLEQVGGGGRPVGPSTVLSCHRFQVIYTNDHIWALMEVVYLALAVLMVHTFNSENTSPNPTLKQLFYLQIRRHSSGWSSGKFSAAPVSSFGRSEQGRKYSFKIEVFYFSQLVCRFRPSNPILEVVLKIR